MSCASVSESIPAINSRALNGESSASACENLTFHGQTDWEMCRYDRFAIPLTTGARTSRLGTACRSPPHFLAAAAVHDAPCLGALPQLAPALILSSSASFPSPAAAVPTDTRHDRLQLTLGTAYTLTRELGGGGMSRVFLAHDAALERDVVVKVLHPDLAAGVSAERFTREIKLAANLHAVAGAYLQHQRARIYLLVGEREQALDVLEGLLAMPYYLSPGWLRIDPNFASLRGDPRFERLAAGR